jgi:hypothetical protein
MSRVCTVPQVTRKLTGILVWVCLRLQTSHRGPIARPHHPASLYTYMIGSWRYSGIPPNRILAVCWLHTPTLDLLGSSSFSRSPRPCILVVQWRELGPSCQASDCPQKKYVPPLAYESAAISLWDARASADFVTLILGFLLASVLLR